MPNSFFYVRGSAAARSKTREQGGAFCSPALVQEICDNEPPDRVGGTRTPRRATEAGLSGILYNFDVPVQNGLGKPAYQLHSAAGVASVESCAMLCLSHQSCQAIAHAPSQQQCFLYVRLIVVMPWLGCDCASNANHRGRMLAHRCPHKGGNA